MTEPSGGVGDQSAPHRACLGVGFGAAGGTTWRTVWRSIGPLMEAMAADPARFDRVTSFGVDEHLWHHVDERRRGPRASTGVVDLTPDQAGRTQARLLDLVTGRSGKAYAEPIPPAAPAHTSSWPCRPNPNKSRA